MGATAKEQTEPGTRLFWSPPDGTTSAGLVVNVATGSTRPPASTTGAVCRLQDGHVIEGGTGTHVSFSARSLSGGTLLRVGLANSPTGPSAIARLTPRVEDYAVDLEAAAGEIVFSTTDASGNAVDGTFWLDNVVVTSRH